MQACGRPGDLHGKPAVASAVAEVTQSGGAVDFGDRKGVVSGDVGAGGVLRGNLDCPVS